MGAFSQSWLVSLGISPMTFVYFGSGVLFVSFEKVLFILAFKIGQGH